MTPLAIALLASVSLQQQAPDQARQQVAETDQGGLYVITGQGGNILFGTGEDGTFVVDDQFQRVAEDNLALIEEVSDGPIVFVLNTHYHGDHTGGNAAFVDAGATVVSREAVRKRLAAEEAGDGDAEKAGEDFLPVITFDEAMTFYWNGEPIRAVALRDAHTDGDAMVYFEESDVLHTGDVFFNGRYPYVDVEAGGSIDGMIAALERIVEIAGPETTIVPGHGPVADEAAAEATIAMLREARSAVMARIEAGDSREAAVAADPLSSLNEDYAWQFIDGDRMTGQLYDSLTKDRPAPTRPARPAPAPAEAERTEAAPEEEDSMADRLNRAQLESEEEQARQPVQPADPVEPAVPATAPDSVAPTPNRGG